MEKWKKIQLIIGVFAAVGGLLIPVVIFIVSQQIARNQEEFNLQQKKSERVATLLRSLSSENERERKLALSYTDYLVQNDMFPEELFDVFLEIARTGTAEEAGEAEKIITDYKASIMQMEEPRQEQLKMINQKIEEIPPRIFIHINREDQRGTAMRIMKALKGKEIDTPGIELLDYEQQGSEIRFFRPEDEEFAHILADIIREQGVECRVVPVKRMKNVRARQFELWMSNGF